jgi:far upstream element-binding protein
MVGRVIGKGGETIKALQKNFGANIQIDQSMDPMKVTIAGQPGAVESAAAAVQEIVNGGNPYLGPAQGASAYGAISFHRAVQFDVQVCLPCLHGNAD